MSARNSGLLRQPSRVISLMSARCSGLLRQYSSITSRATLIMSARNSGLRQRSSIVCLISAEAYQHDLLQYRCFLLELGLNFIPQPWQVLLLIIVVALSQH